MSGSHPEANTTVRSTCAYCGVGCGVVVERKPDGPFTVSGDPAHPANFGRLCAKGAALGDTLVADDRLLHPEINGQRVDWDHAIATVAERFNDVIEKHGPDAVGFYVSGQLLTEDYYVANKLMKGFIGSANIDTNSRLCMASSVAGHKRAFGEDVVPGTYADLEQAELVVLVGSNLAWCHPVLHQRLLAARTANGTRIVVIDPRATATSAECDAHLALAPGSDVALFNGLLRHLLATDCCDAAALARTTNNFAATAATVARYDVDRVARITGLSPTALVRFYEMFTRTRRVVTVYSQGVNQSVAGTDKVNAIINCHLATGRIGLPGAGPFSVTGQPNAMGGRETGGLANTLASHIEFDDDIGVQALADFWHAPRLARKPGLKAVDLFDAVANGRIKALWIMATNPAVSLPDSARVRSALAACPFLVVSEVVRQTDTTDYANVLLPAAGWGEKDGTVTNSERRISRQRAFVPTLGEARPDWWIINRVARAMGHVDAFDFQNPADVFREYVRTTMLPGAQPRVLNLGALRNIRPQTYDALQPFQWPCADNEPTPPQQRLFGDGVFPSHNGKASFIAAAWRAPATSPSDEFPLRATSGRIRDQWHTMSRSGLAPRLAAHIAEPYVEVHPVTAARYGIAAAEIVALRSATGGATVRALLTERVPQDTVFVPMHWSDQNAANGTINRLFTAHCDPVSGQPELKHSAVALTRVPVAWYGFAVTCARPADLPTAYWASMRSANGWRTELAATHEETDYDRLFRELCGPLPTGTEITVYRDPARAHYRVAALMNGRLVGLLYVAPEPVAVSRAWAVGLLGADIEPGREWSVLAGSPGAGGRDDGALICSCNGIGRQQIARAIRDGHETVDEVGRETRAGMSCGSCRMEIRAIIESIAAIPAR